MSGGLQFRSPHPGEAFGFFTPVLRAFGNQPTPAEVEHERAVWEPERSYGALDGEAWVGASGAYSLQMTVPGGLEIPVSGITMVGVAPTHRRRGILNEMMRWLLGDAVERGESVAMLTASESSIYGRFGFGVSASHVTYEIDADAAAFTEQAQADLPSGRFELLQSSDALGTLHEVWDRCRLARPGEMSRPKARWEDQLRDPEARRAGASALFVVVHEGADGPDGFSTFRRKEVWGPDTHRLPETVAVVEDIIGATPAVEAALWRFVTEIDLIREARFLVRPVDDPIRWRLAEPRRLRTISSGDWTWARVLEVPMALAARRYRTEGQLVIELIDPYRPSAAGRFRLEGGPDGATCVAAPEASPDITMGPTELGALYLGGVAPSVLAAAGRIDEHVPGALRRGDLLLPIAPAPFCGTMF
jgi:predicted acetyltransferase